MLNKKNMYLGLGIAASCLGLTTQAIAKDWYPGQQPAIYNNAISCSACHSATPATEYNANTTYGILFGQVSDDDIPSSITNAYIALERYDIDRDGFSNGQELRQASGHFNYATVIPTLAAVDKTSGNVSAKAASAGAVMALTDTGTSFANDMTTFERTTSGVPLTTTDFMFKHGGMQTGATGVFYDENGAIIPANTADGAFTPNFIPNDTTLDGSMRVTVKDDGVFDLYSQAAFIRIAKARTPAFTPKVISNTINPYVSVDAKISPTATIDANAVIDAYAIVDSYAVIGPYAQIGSYAYIAPNVSVNGTGSAAKAIVDPYVAVTSNITTAGTTSLPNGTGYVKATFSITTAAPVIPTVTGETNDGGDSNTGGLHCVTTGLSTPALMFLGLFAASYFIRRKRS